MPRSSFRRELVVIRRLLALLQGQRWFLPIVVVLGLLSAILEGVSLSLFIPLLQTLGDEFMASGNGGPLVDALRSGIVAIPADFRLLAIVGAIFVGILLKNAISYLSMAIYSIVDGRIGHQLRVCTFERIVATPLSVVERERSGRLLNLLSNETWRTCEALAGMNGAIISLSTLIVFLPLLLLLSWQLTLVALACVVAIPPVVHLLTLHVEQLGTKAVAANQSLSRRMWAVFSGLRVIHSFGREEYEVQRFRANSDAVRATFLRLSLISGSTQPVTEVLIVGMITVIALTVDLAMIDVSTLVGFVAILYRMQPRALALANCRAMLLSLQAAVLEVTDFLHSEHPAPKDGIGPFPGIKSFIRFERVTFAYPGVPNTPALAGISLTIQRGSIVAVVGPSGAGKSTLLDLLLRFYDPQEGMICIDDEPLCHFHRASWRAAVAMVSQDPYIFDDTVGENILYGRPEASQDDVVEAARRACADDFIRALPRGYDTWVGDRGVRLSGGQRQRLALARALIRDPELLVLDEATNALDSLTEQALQEALQRFAASRTVLIVAHRLSTIEKADHIVVLNQGHVVEQGGFNDLLDLNGLFAQMYRIQSLTPVAASTSAPSKLHA